MFGSAPPPLRTGSDDEVLILRRIRLIRRDMTVRGRPLEEILDQYLATVRPMHLEFVEPSREHAHLVVPGTGHGALAVSLVLDEVMRHLELREA